MGYGTLFSMPGTLLALPLCNVYIVYAERRGRKRIFFLEWGYTLGAVLRRVNSLCISYFESHKVIGSIFASMYPLNTHKSVVSVFALTWKLELAKSWLHVHGRIRENRIQSISKYVFSEILMYICISTFNPNDCSESRLVFCVSLYIIQLHFI